MQQAQDFQWNFQGGDIAPKGVGFQEPDTGAYQITTAARIALTKNGNNCIKVELTIQGPSDASKGVKVIATLNAPDGKNPDGDRGREAEMKAMLVGCGHPRKAVMDIVGAKTASQLVGLLDKKSGHIWFEARLDRDSYPVITGISEEVYGQILSGKIKPGLKNTPTQVQGNANAAAALGGVSAPPAAIMGPPPGNGAGPVIQAGLGNLSSGAVVAPAGNTGLI